MPILTEGRHPAEAILSELEAGYSRDNLTIAPETEFEANTLLSRVAVAAGTTVVASAADGNTGNGLLTIADPAVNSKAKEGRYTLTITAAEANAGAFKVEDPNGVSIGTGNVGAAFNKEIKFTLADGSTDFAVGDQFFIDVDSNEATGAHYVPWDPEDGGRPVAMAIYGAKTGAAETVQIAGITRQAQLNQHCIAWPEGATDAHKSAAADALRSVGIIIR